MSFEYDHPNLIEYEPASDFYMERPRMTMVEPAEVNYLEKSRYGKNFKMAEGGKHAEFDYNRQNTLRDIEDYFHGSVQTKHYDEHSSRCRCPHCMAQPQKGAPYDRNVADALAKQNKEAEKMKKSIQMLQRRNDTLLVFVVFVVFLSILQLFGMRVSAAPSAIATTAAPVAPAAASTSPP